MHVMDIRQLRYFVRIVEGGSLSQASRELNVAQPALSQQVARLEEAVGRPLLHRTSRGVVPTEGGLALYHHALFVLRQFDQTLAVARRDGGMLHGMVSVGLPATTVSALGLALVRRVRQRHPGILLNVVEGMSGHIARLAAQGQLDLAVLFGSDAAPDMTVEPLMEEELYLILGTGGGILPAEASAVTIAELAQLPLILPTGAHGLRKRIDAEFERRGLSPTVVAEIDSLALVMTCVHDGLGGTIKPTGAVMQAGERARRLRLLPIADARLRRRNYLYRLPPERLTSVAAVVAEELKTAVAELIADRAWSGFAPPGPMPRDAGAP